MPLKYQKTFCKVAPQPPVATIPSPSSKFKSSLIFSKQLESISEMNHEIFTVIINNEWLVTGRPSTKNKYGVSI